MKARILAQLETVSRTLAAKRGSARLLADIAWPRDVEESFFAHHAGRLPEPRYAVDRDALEGRAKALESNASELDGDDVVTNWLRATLQSFADANRLMLAIGTRDFYHRSREIYGSAQSSVFGEGRSHLELAKHLVERLKTHGWDEARDESAVQISASELKAMLEKRVLRRRPKMDVTITLDEHTTAKVVAGMSRVRIRPDATFAPWEAEGLWHHEVETHALSAQNGSFSEHASFLRGGGPRTTRTQEGLAVFSELFNRALSVSRLQRLARRVVLVDMAERGASFLDLYRHLLEQGSTPHDAYCDAQRICRGGLVDGGAPFTKDVCYLAGLLEVVAFLSAVTRGGFRDEIELVVAGRIAIEDVAALAELRALGVLERPRFLPKWLADWETLLPYFAFTSFMTGLDLEHVEQKHHELLRIASRTKPSR